MDMFEKHELKAMAWGYGVAIPIAMAAIWFLDTPLVAIPVFYVGFCVTLWRLSQ